VVSIDAPFCHDLFKVLIGNSVAEIEKHSKKDDVLRIVLALDTDHQAVRYGTSFTVSVRHKA